MRFSLMVVVVFRTSGDGGFHEIGMTPWVHRAGLIRQLSGARWIVSKEGLENPKKNSIKMEILVAEVRE